RAADRPHAARSGGHLPARRAGSAGHRQPRGAAGRHVMSASTTLPADVRPERPTYTRGLLERALSGLYGGADPLAVLAAAVQALITDLEAQAVIVAAIDNGRLWSLRSTIDDRTTLARLLSPERTQADPAARVVVAANADPAEAHTLALVLDGCDV